MKTFKFESSNVNQWKYYPEYRELVIIFKSGKAYRYSDVPPEIHDGAEKAESVGKFFNEKVKKGGFAYAPCGVDYEPIKKEM